MQLRRCAFTIREQGLTVLVALLILTAGIAVETSQGMNKRVHEVDVKDFDRTHAVNERGVWLCCKYALKQMMEQEPREANARGEKTRGWVVNAASMLGLIGLAHGNSYVPGKLFWKLHAFVLGIADQHVCDY